MKEALLGGGIIGIAVSLMLLFNGKITGISGIVSGLFPPSKSDFSWRAFFILGLLTGGVLLRFLHPESFHSQSQNMGLFDYALAGLLVGLGTVIGSGCTSGHGVCGISRFSVRSIVATITFILFGMISVIIFRMLKGDL